MTFYVDYDDEFRFDFDAEKIFKDVAEAVLELEQCPYEAQVNLTITTEEQIKAVNQEFRQIDCVTDVLSFPFVAFEEAGVFAIDEASADSFDPDSGELLLGDIMICYPRALAQAEEYGHSVLREFAFLVAHSMLHLCGYDHMEDAERSVMEEKQEQVLQQLGITRG